MRVRVLYFAAVRDLAGAAEEALDLPAEVRTVRDLVVYLGRRPALGAALGQVRVARNEAFAGMDEALEEGDVVALIPPVSGG